MAWLNEQDKTTTAILSIRLNQRQSGYIFNGVDFDCFAWKSDIIVTHLFTAISTWVEQGIGYELKMTASSNEKRGFKVEFVEVKGKKVNAIWYVADNGFTTRKGEDVIENPFL